MSSDMLNIAASAAKAIRSALDITAQNIANASTEGYIRRSVNLTEQSSVDSRASYGDVTQYGVMVSGIVRNADPFQQSEVRRTNADASRADTLVSGLTNVNDAIENSGVFNSITAFQSALSKLTSNPTDSSLRANLLEAGRTMAQSFNVAHNSLASAISGEQQSAAAGVAQVNNLSQSLAQLNLRIASDTDPLNNRATLLDQRDSLLQQLSGYGDIATTINTNGTVDVKLGGTSGVPLVSANGSNATLSSTTATDGTISFTLGVSPLTLSGGSLAGQQQTLSAAATANATLDGIANSLMSTVNTAQTHGVDLNGTPGTNFFSGAALGAGAIAVALSSGSKIATAPASASAKSLDASNLTALQSSLTSANIAGQMNDLLYSVSSAVAGNTTTRDALDSIYSNAKTTLANQAGVDLDTEAANLVKYQQAFQASGKVIQVSSTLFEQLLQL
jgi:flagellar hook-associated protein 1 FlgK